MEPWDGPAAIAAVAGKWALVGLDRNGLRPMRYVRTSDELLIAGSEAGMVPQDEAKIVEKGRLGPGEMLAVDMDQPLLYKDRELKDMLADTHDYASWTTRTVELNSLIKQDAPRGRALRAGRTAPPAVLGRLVDRGSRDDPPSDGRGRQGSRGLDGRRRAARGAERHLSRHASLLPAEFQPGHQPADRLLARAQRHDHPHAARQSRQHPRRDCPSRARCCRCSRRSCSTPSSRRCASTWTTPAARIDCTFDPKGGLDAMRQAFERICQGGRGSGALAAACTSC